MNKVILMGRLTKDAETRYTQGNNPTAVTRYTLAVNRSYKREGDPDADFINIIAFGNRGEFAGKYFKKGMMVAVVGELRLGNYTDKDGNKHYTTDVIVTEQYFAERKEQSSQPANQQAAQPAPQPVYQLTPGYQPVYQMPGNQVQYQQPAQPVQQYQQPTYNQESMTFIPIDDDSEALPF